MRLTVCILIALSLTACRATRPIQSAIAKKDTTAVAPGREKEDSLRFMAATWQGLRTHTIDYNTFTARVNIEYSGTDGKRYDVNANIRLLKDSAIWVSANALLGIEAFRALITKDSVKILDKLNKTYTARSVDYLQEVSSLPLDLAILQDLIIGNPVFLDTNFVSYSQSPGTVSLLSIGPRVRSSITVDAENNTLQRIRLDDQNLARNRNADLTYSSYETRRNPPFATRRSITVSENKRLDIRLEFKQYEFGTEVSFPFSIPKNYAFN